MCDSLFRRLALMFCLMLRSLLCPGPCCWYHTLELIACLCFVRSFVIGQCIAQAVWPSVFMAAVQHRSFGICVFCIFSLAESPALFQFISTAVCSSYLTEGRPFLSRLPRYNTRARQLRRVCALHDLPLSSCGAELWPRRWCLSAFLDELVIHSDHVVLARLVVID